MRQWIIMNERAVSRGKKIFRHSTHDYYLFVCLFVCLFVSVVWQIENVNRRVLQLKHWEYNSNTQKSEENLNDCVAAAAASAQLYIRMKATNKQTKKGWYLLLIEIVYICFSSSSTIPPVKPSSIIPFIYILFANLFCRCWKGKQWQNEYWRAKFFQCSVVVT
jgi:hypothetical protein